MEYRIYLTALVSFFAYLLGGYDMGIQVMLIMVALDYITGMMKAIVLKRLNSYIGWKGICKKAGLFIAVVVAVQIECITGQPNTIHNVVAFAIVVNEAISIVENLIDINVPVPKVLVDYIKKIEGGK